MQLFSQVCRKIISLLLPDALTVFKCLKSNYQTNLGDIVNQIAASLQETKNKTEA